MQICRRPTSPPASRDICRSAFFTMGKISSATLSSRLPAEVKRGAFVLRTKREHSSLSSRSFSWCDKADCVRKRLSAASTRLPVSRSATSVFRCRSSITIFTIHFRNRLIHQQEACLNERISMYTHFPQKSLTLTVESRFTPARFLNRDLA